MEIIINTSDDKKDLIHANNNSIMAKNVVGKKFKITAILIYKKSETNEETGETKTKTISCIKTDKNEFIATVSPTFKESLEMIYYAYTEEELKQALAKGIDVVIQKKQSKNERDFIFVDVA
jgi:hypothetical protein